MLKISPLPAAGTFSPNADPTTCDVSVTAANRQGHVCGLDSSLPYDLTGTDEHVAHIRKHLPANRMDARAAEVLRSLNAARNGEQAQPYTFDEVTAALLRGADALERNA